MDSCYVYRPSTDGLGDLEEHNSSISPNTSSIFQPFLSPSTFSPIIASTPTSKIREQQDPIRSEPPSHSEYSNSGGLRSGRLEELQNTRNTLHALQEEASLQREASGQLLENNDHDNPLQRRIAEILERVERLRSRGQMMPYLSICRRLRTWRREESADAIPCSSTASC
ncbi:hypothetical protein BT96DRAFT_1013152 [Gymnopus androsaceus JB14]|uniref:Uncharacterized protein n=1 Tax=Gymnopus androsaceus JB14 TaxID=1447944 RepID=A0A6A4IKG5_9AGAR|nr:hypothetical protein BT96DRAFT_1013152 [Gymnopus androsaceus JB14]